MRKRAIGLPLLTAALLTLTACGGTDGQDGTEENMGNARPAVSDSAGDAPDGETFEAPAGLGEISQAVTDGEVVGLRGRDAVAFGTVAQLRDGKAEVVETDPACGTLTQGAGTFVLACGSEVLLFDPANPAEPERRDVEGDATRAALVASGELFTANADEPEIVMTRPDRSTERIEVEDPATELVSVPGRDGERDAVVRTFNPDTTIQDVDWTNDPPRQGGRLRVGLGVGTVAPGEDDILLAADATGGQLAVYTTDDVIRLHQTVPVDGEPWAVAWDPHAKRAWVSSPGDRGLRAFDLSSGSPEQTTQLRAVPDAQSIVVLDDGTLVAVSATGSGVQVVADAAGA